MGPGSIPPDYYALLGVPRSADSEAIRTAYRVLAKQHHPDLAEGLHSLSTDRFLQIQEAYNTLRHPGRRAQYDLECARREAMAAAQRRDLAERQAAAERQAQWPVTPGSRVALRPEQPPFAQPPFRKPPRPTSGWLYVGAVAVVLVVLGGVILQQRLANLAARERTTVVKVDPSRPPPGSEEARRAPRDPNALPPELTALGREFEALSRQQAARVTETKNRMEAEAAARKMAETAPPPQPVPPVQAPAKDGYRRIDCKGEGRAIVVVHQNNAVTVSYNGGPAVKPAISEAATGMVVVSMVEPTNRISIGFMKGDKDGTVVILSDATGSVFRTVGVDCSAAAF